MSLQICHLQNEENDTYLEDQEVHHARGLAQRQGPVVSLWIAFLAGSLRAFPCLSRERMASAPLDGEGIFALRRDYVCSVCILPYTQEAL